MHIQEAMHNAVAGGYHGNGSEGVRVEEMLLDTAFWQALGQTLGWKEASDMGGAAPERACGEWLSYWHSFIDHLVAGKDPASFFACLPSPPYGCMQNIAAGTPSQAQQEQEMRDNWYL